MLKIQNTAFTLISKIQDLKASIKTLKTGFLTPRGCFDVQKSNHSNLKLKNSRKFETEKLLS